jgi:hypothetical protein
VFRYALENWPPDLYDLVVSQRGPLEAGLVAEAEAILRGEGRGAVNAALRRREDPELPAEQVLLTVRFPGHPAGVPPLWTGPWSAESLRRTIASPVRDRLADELVRGATAVFLFLPGGEADADRNARLRLQTLLEELARTRELPPPDDVPPDLADGSAPPALPPIRFPIMDVPREDPTEEFLRTMLRASEPDLAELREPMAFPVFGRGRLLYAIVGAGINRDVLTETCMFLTAACSCQVKAQNPGVDLLLRADWDRALGLLPDAPEELPPLTGLAAAAPVAPASPPEVQAPPTPPPQPRSAVLRWTMWAAGALLIAVLAGTLAVLRGGRRDGG